MKGIPILGSMAFLVGAIALAAPKDARQDLVDAMDKHLQARFADLEATKDGRFGISRVEMNRMDKHQNLSGAPGYESKELQSSISIFGNKGKPLEADSLVVAYSRLLNGTPVGMTSAMAAQPRKTGQNGPIDVAKRWMATNAKGRSGARVFVDHGITYEVRPVRLSKKECLSCHPGMKLNDPVALIVYSTAPFVKAR